MVIRECCSFLHVFVRDSVGNTGSLISVPQYPRKGSRVNSQDLKLPCICCESQVLDFMGSDPSWCVLPGELSLSLILPNAQLLQFGRVNSNSNYEIRFKTKKSKNKQQRTPKQFNIRI